MKAKLIRAEGVPANNGLVEGEVYEVATEEKYPGVYAVMSGVGVSGVGIFYKQDRFEKIEEAK
jgi:hypothetical protein